MSLDHTKAGLGVLAPLVTALSAWLTASVAKYGVHVDASGVNAALVSGATCGIAVMVKLIHDVEKDDPEIKAISVDADAISSAVEQTDPQMREVVRHAIEDEMMNLTHRINQATAISNGENETAATSRAALPALDTDEAARWQPAEQLPPAAPPPLSTPPPQTEQPPPIVASLADDPPMVRPLSPAEPLALTEEPLTAEELQTAAERQPVEEPQSAEAHPPAEELSPTEDPPPAEEPQSVEEHPPVVEHPSAEELSPAEEPPTAEPQSVEEHPPTTLPLPAEQPPLAGQSPPGRSVRSVKIPRLG